MRKASVVFCVSSLWIAACSSNASDESTDSADDLRRCHHWHCADAGIGDAASDVSASDASDAAAMDASDTGAADTGSGDAAARPDSGPTSCAPSPTSSLVVNVRDTGAMGDGVTNDTAALQAAVNKVTGTGGTVYVPDGTYMVDAVTRLFVKSNMTLRMSSGAVLKAIPNGETNYDVIRINYATNVTVVGGTIEGERAAHTGTAGEWGFGLSIYGSSNVVVDGVTAKDTWGDGFIIGPDNPTNVTFCNVTADNNRRQGLSIITGTGITVRDSTFKNTNGTPPAAGIDIEPDDNETVNGVRITSSTFTNNDSSGVIVTLNPKYNGRSFIKNVVIDRNTMTGNDRHFYNVNAEGGVVLLNVSGVTVSNNVIRGDVKDGIHLGQAGTPSAANNNLIQGNTVTNNGGYGIFLEDGSTGNSVISNTVTGNTKGQIVDQVGGNSIK